MSEQLMLGLVRNDAADTSREAAVLRRKKVERDRACILACLREHPRTDDELQHALGLPPNTQRPRRVELVRQGKVRDSGVRRKTETGRNAIVWESL